MDGLDIHPLIQSIKKMKMDGLDEFYF